MWNITMGKYTGNKSFWEHVHGKSDSGMVDKFDQYGLYRCIYCGKLTRNVSGEGAMQLCKKCYKELEQENADADSNENGAAGVLGFCKSKKENGNEQSI
jgi:hypothetical protein